MHRLSLQTAYDRAFDNVVKLTEHLLQRGVQSISVYFLSRKNLRRPIGELKPVYAAQARICNTVLAAAAERWDAEVKVVGGPSLVSGGLCAASNALKLNDLMGADG